MGRRLNHSEGVLWAESAEGREHFIGDRVVMLMPISAA